MNLDMEVFLLGAGRPAQGSKPAALRKIALDTRAMDWQLHSFQSVVDVKDISFLGGYQTGVVARSDRRVEKYGHLSTIRHRLILSGQPHRGVG